MPIARREHTPAVPAVRSPMARLPQAAANVPFAAPHSPQLNDDLPLARVLARAVQERCSETRTPEPLTPVTEPMIQRSVGHPAKDLPPCTPLAADKPDEKTWISDPVLQKVRIDPVGANKQIIAVRSDRPHVRRATQLVEEALLAWGCEQLGVDVLDGKTPDGEFDAKTKTAINAFQAGPRTPSETYLAMDGKVGPLTLSELDWFIGHTPAPAPQQPVPPPPPKPEPPPIQELNDDQIRALVFVVIGTRPTSMTWDQWIDVLMTLYDVTDTFIDAIEGGTMLPVPWWEMCAWFGEHGALVAGRDALNAFTYGIMDAATGRHRSPKELADARAVNVRHGFVTGYRVIKKHLYSTNAQTTTHLKLTLDALAAQPDRARTMKTIYKALRDTYGNRPPFDGHNLQATRHCAFKYPDMRLACGPRGDILRPPP